jgi:hypothetical protein
LYDKDGTSLGRLDGVSGGTIDYSTQATIKSSGQLNCRWTRPLNGLQVGVEYILDEGEPHERAWSLGRFWMSTPATQHNEDGKSVVAEMYDNLLLMTNSISRQTLGYAADSIITDKVKELIAASGVTEMAVTDSPKKLRNDTSWEAGTTRLQEANELLDSAGYFSAYADPSGQIVCKPYIAPNQRPVAWVFREGEFSIHSASFTEELDEFSIPNVIVAKGQIEGDQEALSAYAVNDDPDNPYSIPFRGYEVGEVLEGLVTTSQADLQAYVDNHLKAVSDATRTLDITHAWVPIALNDVVEFDSDQVTGHFVVSSFSVPLDPLGLVSTHLREVKWLTPA